MNQKQKELLHEALERYTEFLDLDLDQDQNQLDRLEGMKDTLDASEYKRMRKEAIDGSTHSLATKALISQILSDRVKLS